MEKIFNYTNYQVYLNNWIENMPKKGRGMRRALALHIGIPQGQLTRILSGDFDFTVDQAVKAISFLELSKLEGQFFVGLVELARGGNMETREMKQERLAEIKKQAMSPESIQNAEKYKFSEEDLKIYFESWYYTAIEILTQIPGYQTLDSICEYFKIPKSRALDILNFLVEKGVVRREGKKYIRDQQMKFENLEPGSLYLKSRSISWRNRALVSLDDKEVNNLNLTMVFSLAKDDVPRFKEALIDKIKELYNSTEGPKPEEISCICLDFFKVKG